MEIQDKTSLLCLLLKAKAHEPFYNLNKREINFSIKVVKNSINAESNNPKRKKGKFNFKKLSDCAVPIIKLITAFLNTS